MGSGFGLSRAMSGAVEGLNQTEARRDRASNREYQGLQRERETTQYDQQQTQYKQGQEDREYALGRRDVETGRADSEYKRLEGNRQRKVKVNDALKQFAMDGSVDGMKGVANEFGPAGVTYEAEKNDDGTYTTTTTNTKTGKSESNVVDADELATGFMMFNDDDFAATMQSTRAAQSDRKHDLAKIDREYSHKKDIEGIKATGKGSENQKSMAALNKEQADLSKEYYGKSYDGMFSFDTKSKKRLSAAHTSLAGAYRKTGDMDGNDAHWKAAQAMQEMEDDAMKAADAELDSGQIGKDEYEARVSTLIDTYVNYTIKKMAPAPGQTLGRGGDDGAGTVNPNAPTIDTFVEDSVKDLSGTPEAAGLTDDEIRASAREDYANRFGGGGPAKQEPDANEAPALKRPANDVEAAAEPTDTGGSIPGISDASASEAPDLKRQKQQEKNRAEEAATEESRRDEQRSGMKPATLKRASEKKASENEGKAESASLDRGTKKAQNEQDKFLRRYRKLKSTARAKIMSKRELGLALLAADSKEEKADITRLLKGKK